jgi:hypothetical protein
LNKKPTRTDFKKSQRRTTTVSSEQIWLKLILENPVTARQILGKQLIDDNENLSSLYDLRDWIMVVQRSPEHLPEEFNVFSDFVDTLMFFNRNLSEF